MQSRFLDRFLTVLATLAGFYFVLMAFTNAVDGEWFTAALLALCAVPGVIALIRL